jgi:GGDEF domain-containing protein
VNDEVPPEEIAQPMEFPKGMQNRDALQRLLDCPGSLFSGLVVSVGINDYENLQASRGLAAHEELLRSVIGLLESILGDRGFGARCKQDEFALVFPGQTGAAGQRLLTQFSERLWDFQLRSLASMSILCSWGAVDVTAEPLADAISAANERMCQTKRTRRGSTDFRESRKRVMAM